MYKYLSIVIIIMQSKLPSPEKPANDVNSLQLISRLRVTFSSFPSKYCATEDVINNGSPWQKSKNANKATK